MSFVQPLLTAEELLVWDSIVCPNINTNIAESWMMNLLEEFAFHTRPYSNASVGRATG
jgi:hypothetical protein